jgi:hypothetical protein
VSGKQEVTYTLDFCARRQGGRENETPASDRPLPAGEPGGRSTPRIARLMALAIRFEGLLREETIPNYAELARLGRVTRARMTQIMKLLDLAPDIQERILFLPPIQGLNERSLRPLVSRIDWNDQRLLFQKIRDRLAANAATEDPAVPHC